MDEIGANATQDETLEAIVLQQLLALHPVQLTLAELKRELGGDPGGFAIKDAVERAVRELAAAGLAHRNGKVVLPSRAALRFDELLG